MAHGGADSPFDVVEDVVEHSSWHVVDIADCPVDTKAELIDTIADDDMVGNRNAFQELLDATIRIRDTVAPGHADMVIWNLVKADSHPLILKSIPTRSVNERCLKSNCGFRPHHNVAEFGGYCCKKCGTEKYKGKYCSIRHHGPYCQRLPSWRFVDCTHTEAAAAPPLTIHLPVDQLQAMSISTAGRTGDEKAAD